MGNKLEVIGANLVPDTPASFSSAPQQIAPVSALDDAKAAKKYDDNKFDKLFSWETPKAVLEGMPTMGILNVAADKISPYIPEVKISDTLSFGGQGPLITNSQPVTDERLEQYAKSMNVPEEYWQDLRSSKDMTEVYTKTSRILSDIKGQQHLAQVYGSTALTMGSVFFDPTFYLGNAAGNLMAASVKSASIAKSLAAVGALKQTTAATKVAEAVSSMGKALPAQASAVAGKAASVAEAAAGKSGGFLVDTLNYSGTNVLLGELDANVRGRETTPTEFYMNALVGAVAPHVIGALGKTYTASNAWLHNRTVKALNEIGAKAAQEKFKVEPTDKLNEMTIGEKVSHGDEAIEPRLSDTGPAQGDLFDATGLHQKDPQLDSMVRALLGDEPIMTEGVAPEGQLELDFLGEPKRVPVETPEVAPVVETTPVVEAEPVASPDVPIEIVTPKELLRARPSYILDGVRFTPRFKSSIDKALFIVGQDARSAHDVKYMEMLRQVFPKLSDAEIREAGQEIKAKHMRGNAKVAIETKGLPRGTDAELPVDTTWKDNVNPIGKDHEPVTHEGGPVVPKEGLQPEQLKELEAATPEVQQKVVQKVLDQKVEAQEPVYLTPEETTLATTQLDALKESDFKKWGTDKGFRKQNRQGVWSLYRSVETGDYWASVGRFGGRKVYEGASFADAVKSIKENLGDSGYVIEKGDAEKVSSTTKANTLHPATEGFPALEAANEPPIKATVTKKTLVAEDIDWDSALLAPFKDSKMLSKKSAHFWKGKTWKEIGVLVTNSTDVSLSSRMKEDVGNGGSTSLFAPSKVVKEYFLTDGRHKTTIPEEVGAYIEALSEFKTQKALDQKVEAQKAETTVIPAADQKVEIKTDYGMNDHFTAALEADLNAWKARENIQDSDTEGYGWEIRKTGLHGALRLLTFFPGKGRMDFDIKSQAEGIAKIRGMIADAPNDQLNIQKRWDAFNEEASKVQQQVVQKDVAQKDGVSAQTDGINSYDAPGVSAIKELVAGKPVGPDGFVSVSMMTAREVSVYKKAAYTDPWGTGKKIPIAEKLKDIKKPIAILEIDPVPVRIPNEFFPDTGDFAYFRVKAQLPGKKTPQEVMLKAWSFEGTPKAPKVSQSGFKKETTDVKKAEVSPEVISTRFNRYVGGQESWANKFIQEMPAELRAEIEKDITEAVTVYRKARDAHDARDSAKTDAAMAIHNDMEEAILKKLKEYRDTVEAAYVAKDVALSRQFHELNAESRKNHMAYLKKDLAALDTAAVGEPIIGKNFFVASDADKLWWTAHSNGKKGEMHLGLYGNEVEAWKKAVADAKRMLQDEVKAEKAARKQNRSEEPFDEAAATIRAKERFEAERWRGQSGFITPGVALGLLAGSGLGVYAVGQASQGKDLKETLGSALSGLGGLMIIGMTKGNKSVVEALAHGKTLADVVKLPEVKANPEAVTLKTAQGQDLKLIDLAAKTGRLTDGTPFHMGTIRLPFFGKTRVSDPSGEISAEIRNSDSETGRSLGNLIASSIAGHKTKGAMNHSTADVYAHSTAKTAIHAVGDAFDKGFIAWANRDGKVSPDFIKAYSKKLITEFNDQVVRAKKGETEGVHPEAIKAAKAIADSEARLLQMAADLHKEGKALGVVAEGSAWDLTGQIVAEPTYVHRSASSRGLYELTASVGIEKVHLLIQRALQKGNPELSPQFAAEMAPAYAKTLASLEHSSGLKVNDMNPDELLQHIKDVTQLTPEKAEELSKLFMGHKVAGGVSGILKKRTRLDDTFEMSTTDLQGNPVTISMRQLFNQDIRMNHAHWVNSVSGVIGMARVSLDAGVDLTHGGTFQRLLDQMKGELLEKSVPYNRAMKQVDTIRDLHAKILGKQNADGIFKPANEAIRLLNDTTTLLSHAGFVFSAGAELAAAVQRRGLEAALNDMPELGQVVKAALGGEIDDGLARSLITAHALGDHQTAAMQLGLEQGNLSGASGAVQTAIGQTAKMNFFSTATASTKYLAIKAALQELSDVARGVRTLTPEQWNHFKLRGMSQELLEEIKPALLKATAVDENGMLLTDGSGYRPLDMFKDNAKAAMDLHAHLERQGNAAASESSGAGETNRYMHNDIGRTLGKFQGTPLILTAKLKGNLNNFDASVAASWITTSLGAALAYIMSTYVSNHGDQETMKKKLTTKEIAKATFRNGFSGIAPNVIDLAATMTGQEAPFAGVTNSGRQGGVDVPAFRTIQRVKDTAATVGHALTGQQVTRAEAAQAVKTPLWALNAFIPFATAPLPKKREQAKKP